MSSEYAVAQCLLELAIQNRALWMLRNSGPLNAASGEVEKAREEYMDVRKDIQSALVDGADAAKFSSIFHTLMDRIKVNHESRPFGKSDLGLS